MSNQRIILGSEKDGCNSERNITSNGLTGHFGFNCTIHLDANDIIVVKAQADGPDTQFDINGSAITNPSNVRWNIEKK